uniref:Uncharacterized protein n=1 Tax=Oryza brachyantha TaxID=4533 RepID=J3LUY9_ORYBR
MWMMKAEVPPRTNESFMAKQHCSGVSRVYDGPPRDWSPDPDPLQQLLLWKGCHVRCLKCF